MPFDVHLRPGRLRAHAAEAAELAAGLQRSLDRCPAPGAPDLDRLTTTLRRAVAELAELGAVLGAAAEAAERADGDVARQVSRVGPT